MERKAPRSSKNFRRTPAGGRRQLVGSLRADARIGVFRRRQLFLKEYREKRIMAAAPDATGVGAVRRSLAT
jgi:hypothetical protein